MALNRYSVFNAALTLLQANHKKPTRAEVHKYFGGTGSRSTVQKHMTDWENEYRELIAAIDGAAQTQSIPEPLIALVTNIYKETCAAAESIAGEAEDLANQRIAAADAAIKKKDKEIANIRTESNRACELLEVRLDGATQEAADARSRVAALEDDVSHWRGQVDHQNLQINNLVKELQEQREGFEELEAVHLKDSAGWDAERKVLTARISRLCAHIEALESN